MYGDIDNTKAYKRATSNQIDLSGDKVNWILDGINRHLMELAKEQIGLIFAGTEQEVQALHVRTKEEVRMRGGLNGSQISRERGSMQITKKSVLSEKGFLTDMEAMTLTGIGRKMFYKYGRGFWLEERIHRRCSVCSACSMVLKKFFWR